MFLYCSVLTCPIHRLNVYLILLFLIILFEKHTSNFYCLFLFFTVTNKLTIIPKNLAGKAASELKMNPDL
jgi:hypothetical protein